MSAVLNPEWTGNALALVSEHTIEPTFSIILDPSLRHSAEVKDRVVSHATRALIHHDLAQKHAAGFCMAVFQAREAHGPAGWDEFAKRNIPRMSASNIRAAVRAGKMLCEQLGGTDEQKRRVDGYDALSLSALSALAGASEETLEKVNHLIAMDPKSPPTASEITALRRAEAAQEAAEEGMRAAQEQLRTVRSALEAKESDIRRLEQRQSEGVEMLRQTELAVTDLQDRLAEQERAARTPVESIVHKLPAGVASLEELEIAMRKDLAEKTARRDKMKGDLELTMQRLQEAQRALENQKQAADVIAQIQHDIAGMLLKYPRALTASVTAKTPAAKPALEDIAMGLRALADQIFPVAP